MIYSVIQIFIFQNKLVKIQINISRNISQYILYRDYILIIDFLRGNNLQQHLKNVVYVRFPVEFNLGHLH